MVIVIWSGNPLSVYSKVERTYVDGKLLFSLENNIILIQRDLKEKMRIINKMESENVEEEGQKVEITHNKLYHCETIEDYE